MSDHNVIWYITDSKPGHVNQMRGLIAAINSITPVQSYSVNVTSRSVSIANYIFKCFPLGADMPDPAIIFATGHATHLSLLAARRARGGHAIVLMKPSLPLRFFDLCIIPEHDNVKHHPNVITTRGVLNAVTRSTTLTSTRGLILIGGPSSHHKWSNENIVRQIHTILQYDSNRQWMLTTSRRTPSSFLPLLQSGVNVGNISIVPFEQTTPDWVPAQLATASQVWVSQDSVSMVYEALTAGAAVGLLEVEALRIDSSSRVVRGLTQLIDEHWVTPYNTWLIDNQLKLPPQQLNETARCAQIIYDRFLAPRNNTP